MATSVITPAVNHRASPPYTFLTNDAAMPQTPPSANTSPTSSYPHLHVRQLRPPKQPLYTPACLRPTEPQFNAKEIPDRPRAPDTPPHSKHSSFDSGKSRAAVADAGEPPLVASPATDDWDALRNGLSRVASQSLEDELDDVTGPPTIAHWKPDASASSCAMCRTPFTWFLRRHHCRSCGDLVCGTHLSHTVPLDQNARYHPAGMSSKSCDACFREWKAVKQLRLSRTNSRTASQTSSQTILQPPLPIPQQQSKQSTNTNVGSMARSEGMIWSTF